MNIKQYNVLRKLITICLEGVKRNMTVRGMESANSLLKDFDDEFKPKPKKAVKEEDKKPSKKSTTQKDA